MHVHLLNQCLYISFNITNCEPKKMFANPKVQLNWLTNKISCDHKPTPTCQGDHATKHGCSPHDNI